MIVYNVDVFYVEVRLFVFLIFQYWYAHSFMSFSCLGLRFLLWLFAFYFLSICIVLVGMSVYNAYSTFIWLYVCVFLFCFACFALFRYHQSAKHRMNHMHDEF